MKITHRREWLLYAGFSTVIYGFFVVLALMMQIFWLSPVLVLIFGSGIAIPIYWRYHFKHSGKKEKKRMASQKQINRFYYDRWYTPADSTELDYQIERFKKRKMAH